MKLKEYERHVIGQLCWVCHFPTGPSSAKQWQCRRCRRKWSYRQRQIRWNLLHFFATAITPAEAARRLKISCRTAWTHFLRFERTARQSGNEAAYAFLAHRTEVQSGRWLRRETAPDQQIITLLYESECKPPSRCFENHLRS